MRWSEGHSVQPKVTAAITESYHIHVLQLTNEELARKEAWGPFLESPDN